MPDPQTTDKTETILADHIYQEWLTDGGRESVRDLVARAIIVGIYSNKAVAANRNSATGYTGACRMG